MRVYAFRVPAKHPPPEQFDRLSQLLPQAAQDRIKRFRLPDDALRSLIGRLAPLWYLRKSGLISKGDTPKIESSGKGKPKLVSPVLDPALDFNTSHEGGFVLLAVTRGTNSQVGVDVMELPADPREVQEGISEQLAIPELQSLSTPMSEQTHKKRITLLWTFKECYVKAIGEGIVFGMERIRVDISDEGEVENVFVDEKDFRDDGWKWGSGWLRGPDTGGKEVCGWCVMYRGDEEGAGEIEEVGWEELIQVFEGDI